jgi:hypothetical protein
MEKIASQAELNTKIPSKGRTLLLLYKGGSEQSECAYRNAARPDF